MINWPATDTVLVDIYDERSRQDEKWGEQNHPDGTNDGAQDIERADAARIRADLAARGGTLTWRHILDEEVQEAFAEVHPARLRAELIQVAAVATAWVEHIDRRGARSGTG